MMSKLDQIVFMVVGIILAQDPCMWENKSSRVEPAIYRKLELVGCEYKEFIAGRNKI